MLVAPLIVLLGQSSAGAVDTLCLPGPDKACIAGTLRTEDGVLPDVTITVTDEAGTVQEAVTSDTGKWNVQVDEEGTYTVALDKTTLPKDLDVAKSEITVQAKFGATLPALFDVRTASYDASTSKVDELVQSGVNGLRLGLLLALASVGLSLIYGTTGLSNFAHAEQVTLGGVLGYLFVNSWGLNLWIGGVLVVLACAFSGYFQDRVLWQPLRRRGLGLTQMIIVTIGLSLSLQYVFQYFLGAGTVRVVQDNPSVRTFGSVTITNQSLVAMAISIVVLAAVGFALLRTRIGRATRAVSDNPALASASGIDTDKVIRLVWTVAMGLAGLSGILYALVVNGIKWDSGLQILLLLFAAVTLGGLGTAFGALLGALVIGLVVEVSPVVGMPGDFKYATALLILILLLLVRPQGLLGKPQRVG
ncbi:MULTISPECIES: branched-chain amino acid ABC transporter permease [unclassified Nocardioides]|uniref:branched-chain amino acid ABC transporter permease n=1 Tax=unclassified Nocardioides TaxID=2615069 RepID=UPI0009F001D5|nr:MULTISPECIES: branched-chain amino acid ABC transporter permease [unclassified Nocardioides]GAW51455.1 Branched-chain amino acid ABC-type transport system, permease components [Nocardioides sp. PD653-B2]GAW54112.1 Branched-chain amino acid ABC-type transport system, permease components [Nocardioides sp. PD653]